MWTNKKFAPHKLWWTWNIIIYIEFEYDIISKIFNYYLYCIIVIIIIFEYDIISKIYNYYLYYYCINYYLYYYYIIIDI